MQLFNKLPGYRRVAPGRERDILRCLPMALTLGIGLLMLPSLLLRLSGHAGWATSDSLSMVDIYAMGGVLLYVNGVILVGLSAFIVMLMKGPAYVADAYELSDANAPRQGRRRNRRNRAALPHHHF